MHDNDYELTPEKYKTLSSTGYTGKSMKKESDILLMSINLNDLGYTGIGDRESKTKRFFTKTLPKLVEKIQNKTFDDNTDEFDDLRRDGTKIVIPSNIIDIYTRLEVLPGLKLSGHTDTLTEASNLIDQLYKRGEIQNKQQYRNVLNKFSTIQTELPSKLSEQIAYNTRGKIGEHMLVVMHKSTHEERLSQSLQTSYKQFKVGITFLTSYNGIFNITKSNNKFYFIKSISDDDGYTQTTIPPGAYGIESLNNEVTRIIIDEGHYTEANYPFTIKPNFSTLGSVIEISTQRPIISFMFDDSIRDRLGFNARTLY